MTERPLLVVNPNAGGGRAGRTFGELRAPIERALGACDVATTERRGHAIDLARDAADEGRALVVCVGGDGTMNEVANGVLASSRKDTQLGFIGQGTGGDFRRTLGLEHRLDAYLTAIARGTTRAVDAGRLAYTGDDGATHERFFLNIVSAGMGGLVDRYVAETSKAAGGKAAYMWASVRAIARCARGRLACEVTLGGKSEARRVDSYMIAICNGRYFGSGMHVAPMAQPDDGRFEVVSIGGEGKLALTMTARKIYDGGHLRAPGVAHFACERIAMRVENREAEPFLLDVDGEPIGRLPCTIEVLPRAITLRV